MSQRDPTPSSIQARRAFLTSIAGGAGLAFLAAQRVDASIGQSLLVLGPTQSDGDGDNTNTCTRTESVSSTYTHYLPSGTRSGVGWHWLTISGTGTDSWSVPATSSLSQAFSYTHLWGQETITVFASQTWSFSHNSSYSCARTHSYDGHKYTWIQDQNTAVTETRTISEIRTAVVPCGEGDETGDVQLAAVLGTAEHELSTYDVDRDLFDVRSRHAAGARLNI